MDLDSKRRRSINMFAIFIVLLIGVPETVGHSLFDKPHPTSSSVNAAVSLTDKLNKGYPETNFGCHLTIQNDPSSTSDVSRAAGLEGKYGKYTCGADEK
ncbi:MAG: hypothetical protein ACREBI_10340 [Nitrosotalea sp.]